MATREEVLNRIEKIALRKFKANPAITWNQLLLILDNTTPTEQQRALDAINSNNVKDLESMWRNKMDEVVRIKARAVRDRWDNDTDITLEELGHLM